MPPSNTTKRPFRRHNVVIFVFLLWLVSSAAASADPTANNYLNEIRLKRARSLYTAGHVTEARRIVEPMCNRPDSTAQMYCLLAETYIDDYTQDSKDSKKIENSLKAAMKVDPSCSLAYKDMAEYYNIQGDYKHAVEYSSIALSGKQPYIYALRQRAIAYSNLGKYEKALADINAFIAPGTTTEPAYIMKAGILEKLNRYDDAVTTYRQALAIRRQDMTFYNIARCLEVEHKYAEAIEQVSLLIKINPHDAEALAVRAKLQRENKNLKAALDDYSKAIDMDPSARLYKARADLYLILGQKQAAERDLAQAKKLVSSDY